MSVAVLVLNDHVLKSLWPGVVSGKISDFAGLFAFPLFFSAFMPGRRAAIYWSTGAAFVLWKTAAVDPLLHMWNSLPLYELGRTKDATDLVALVILPPSYSYSLRATAIARGALARAAVCLATLIAFAATSFRTTFDYQSVYFTPISRQTLVDTFYDLEREGYDVFVARTPAEFGSMLGKPSRYEEFVDSGHWFVELWVPDPICFDHVDALMSLVEDPDGTRIRLLEMVHRCPEGDGDREALLRVFNEKLARKLNWRTLH